MFESAVLASYRFLIQFCKALNSSVLMEINKSEDIFFFGLKPTSMNFRKICLLSIEFRKRVLFSKY